MPRPRLPPTQPTESSLRAAALHSDLDPDEARANIEAFNATVWPMAREFVLPSRIHANLVVSGEEPLEHSIGAVLRAIPASAH